MRQASVDDVGARYAAPHARAHASIFGTMPLARPGSIASRARHADGADHLVAGRPVGVQALDVGEHDELVGTERDRASAAAAVSALTL